MIFINTAAVIPKKQWPSDLSIHKLLYILLLVLFVGIDAANENPDSFRIKCLFDKLKILVY